MNWRAEDRQGTLWIFPGHIDPARFGNEPVLKLQGNTIAWNSYYLQNSQQLVDELRGSYQEMYREMRVEYARTAILAAFRKIGFHFLEDLHFRPTGQEKHQFFMKGESKLREEQERTAKIRFTILTDGTVRTDSDYIPEDIHLLADKAMAELEAAFGNARQISPREIPARYLHKAFCHRKDVITLRQGKK
jgi:hypothetical protein